MNRTLRRPTALALGALLLAGTLIVPATALAAGNTIRIVVPASLPGVGGTFNVDVVINNDIAVSAGQTSFTFDKSRLLLTNAVAVDPVGAFNVPDGSGIANANAAGKVVQLSSSLNPPATIAGNGADKVWARFTFQVVACGQSGINIIPNGGPDPIKEDSYLIEAASGDPISPLSTVNGDVGIPCPTPTPTPAPQTPTPPPASAPPGAGSANVTGTVDAGFLGIAVPENVAIPLVRNATNTKEVDVTVFSNIIWNLNVEDLKAVDRGHMTDGAKKLLNQMFVEKYNETNTLINRVDLEVAGGGLFTSGANSTIVKSTLSQFVAPQDPPGAYSIQVTYSALSGF